MVGVASRTRNASRELDASHAKRSQSHQIRIGLRHSANRSCGAPVAEQSPHPRPPCLMAENHCLLPQAAAQPAQLLRWIAKEYLGRCLWCSLLTDTLKDWQTSTALTMTFWMSCPRLSSSLDWSMSPGQY